MNNVIKARIGVMAALPILALSLSCGSTKTLVKEGVDSKMTAQRLIKAHYGSTIDFTTLSGKLKVDYTSDGDTQGFSLSFRMKKDEVIWVSAPFGVVKAYITPERVSFYNRLQGEYFDGDFSYLNGLLGAALDFEKLQNVLLGNAFFDLRKHKYELLLEGKYYGLRPKQDFDLFALLLLIKPDTFKMAVQQVSQPDKGHMLKIDYVEYQKLGNRVIPQKMAIEATTVDKNSTIGIHYHNMEFDRELRFPYKIPNGFNEIVLKKDDF